MKKLACTPFGPAFPDNGPAACSGEPSLRALINNPDAMILDEPFRGLDAMMKKLMLEYYARLSAEQLRTNLFVTTDIDEAIFLADRLLLMSAIPTRVRAVIEVALPRPRQFTDLSQTTGRTKSRWRLCRCCTRRR